MIVHLTELAAYLDAYLRIGDTPDYPPALNGVQLAHVGPVRSVAAAVDFSSTTIQGTIDADANLLIVHHGMFWGGLQRIDGRVYERLKLLFAHDVAVYAAHLPLDAHPVHGNSRLLAGALGLAVSDGFAPFDGTYCGVRGESDVETRSLRLRLEEFAREHGGSVVASPFGAGRRTKRWAICSGAGADAKTLGAASALGVDTLIVGEGPHWTAVDAIEREIVMLYAGHYATETLGVCSLAEHLRERFGLPWTFVPAPTGL